ncbi:MAG: histidinol dehydrogenase [Propionibacteriaceae bacterium]|nr:histidinol dehydrogenase [Propionibacteriaceae bacterium]
MVRLIDFRGVDKREYASKLPRAEFDVTTAMASVAPICHGVRQRGQDALREFSQQFDHVVPLSFRVDPQIIADCAANLDPQLKAAFVTSIERRRAVARAEADVPDRAVDLGPGARVDIRYVPVRRVGLYVPGGLAPLASSVIMNVVPAQVAGVSSLALASPPGPNGLPNASILALCHMLGVDEVYAVGGAQAIAMFAYGVDGLCEPVDMITGPGNIYVVAAKRLVKGVVGIDSEAGPTEIAIVADDQADPRFVAADLMSQAEHDPNAAAVLITDSRALIDQVSAELSKQVHSTAHADRVRQALNGPQSGAILVSDIDAAIDVANAYAAEHLEIQTASASEHARRIHNAGAVFVGAYAPVSLGDYSAGSTHVLPTCGTARHSSGLTVRSFMKTMHVIAYDALGLAEVADGVEIFAQAEKLPAHANAIAQRQSSRAQSGSDAASGSR